MVEIEELRGNVQVYGPGYARGPVWKARVVKDADLTSKFKEGSILVVPDGDYDFSFALDNAVGALVEQNDKESRVVKLCRENNIPCLVGVEGLTDWVDRYDYLSIDTRLGLVKKFSPSPFSSNSSYQKKQDSSPNKENNPPTKPRSILNIIFGRH